MTHDTPQETWGTGHAYEQYVGRWSRQVARPFLGQLDQAERFPVCEPDALQAPWQAAGLKDTAVTAIDLPTVFRDFDDYWQPFLGKQGAAPTYLASLDAGVQGRFVRSCIPGWSGPQTAVFP